MTLHVGNIAPTASPVVVTTVPGTPVDLMIPAADADGDALTFTIGTPPETGTVTGTGPSFTYTPTAGFAGTDVFTVIVSDGIDSVTVLAAIIVANECPVADPAEATTPAGQPLALEVDATDPDGDTLEYSISSGPAHGTLTGTGPSFTYTPAFGFVGDDTFVYNVVDPYGAYAEATVTVHVVQAATELVASPALLVVQVLKLKLGPMTATLTSRGVPVPGQTITFSAGSATLCTAATNASGVASCSATITGLLATVLNLGYTARYAGIPAYAPSSASGALLGPS